MQTAAKGEEIAQLLASMFISCTNNIVVQTKPVDAVPADWLGAKQGSERHLSFGLDVDHTTCTSNALFHHHRSHSFRCGVMLSYHHLHIVDENISLAS